MEGGSVSHAFGCRIIEEFDDDASDFADAEPEFVPLRCCVPSGNPASKNSVITHDGG